MKKKNVNNNLLILGAGGHGKVVADIALTMNKWNNIAFLDDREDLKVVLGIPVVGKLQDYNSINGKFKYAFVAIGNNQLRLEWIDRLSKKGFTIPSIVHPFSFISNKSIVDYGTVVMAGSIVNADTKIGKGCIINTSSSIDHDCVLEDGVHISPGVHIGGTVNIGKYTWICIGSSIANNVAIGSNVVVAAGAAVTKDIPKSVMVAGAPAKIIKQFGVIDND